MVVQHHREGTLALEEERRRAVTESLARVGQRETDLTDLAQRLGGALGVRHGSDAQPAPAPRSFLDPFAERARRLEHILGGERDHVVAVELGELGAFDRREPERLPVQRLLEDRPGEARVAEALAAARTGEDPLERLLRARLRARTPLPRPACG